MKLEGVSLENLGFVQEKSDSHTKTPNPLILKRIELLQSPALGCKCLEDIFQRLSQEFFGGQVAAVELPGPFPPHPCSSQRAQLCGGWEKPPPRAQGPLQGQTQHGLALLGLAQALLRGG